MKALIEPNKAKSIIAAHQITMQVIDCPLEKCAGRILREEVIADRPLPPYNRAMMDGYAIRVADISEVDSFKIVAQAPAGSTAQVLDSTLGSCIEIMTGAVVPEGANCVVPYEETKSVASGIIRLTLPEDQHPGDAIHPIGSDHASGSALIETGRVLGSREVTIAATCGYSTLKVSRLPSIAIVSTGDELVAVSEIPEAHQIRRSNDHMVETALARAGFPAQERVHLIDEPDSATQRLKKLIEENDIVIISGGISMGKKDFIPEALTANGLDCRFHGVAQKPGKPFGFWSNDSCMVFALPGNPLSTLTCLHHYVIPSLVKSCAGTARAHSSVRVSDASGRPHLTVFMPVSIDKNNQATCRPTNNSGDLVSILSSDGYIELPPSKTPLGSQTLFTFYPWL